MQKTIFLLFPLLGLVALTGGCAAMAALPSTFGSLNPSSASVEIHNQTEVKLTEGNFVVMKTNVVGQARGFALLGIITMVPARFQTAMDRLYTNAEMQNGKPQTLSNLIMEKSSAYWILFSIPRISVRADVVEFTPNATAIILPRPAPEASPPEGDKSGMTKSL